LKKSEAIKRIDEFLKNINTPSIEMLLLFLTEELEMLPPNIDKIIEGHLCTENVWEKE
jgi:hypothetical protein